MADIKLEMEALMAQIKTKIHTQYPLTNVRETFCQGDFQSDFLMCSKEISLYQSWMAGLQYSSDSVSLDYYSKKSNSNNLVLHQLFDIQMEPQTHFLHRSMD